MRQGTASDFSNHNVGRILISLLYLLCLVAQSCLTLQPYGL